MCLVLNVCEIVYVCVVREKENIIVSLKNRQTREQISKWLANGT